MGPVGDFLECLDFLLACISFQIEMCFTVGPFFLSTLHRLVSVLATSKLPGQGALFNGKP